MPHQGHEDESDQLKIAELKRKLAECEARLRDRTGQHLANHSLVKDFHTYRETKRAEADAKLVEFTLKHSAKQKLTPSDQQELEKLRRENKNLKLDCFRVQKMLLKA